MKSVSRLGMGLALLVFAMAGGSDGAIDIDSTNWENSWEGDVTPPAPWAGWAGIDGVGGGINDFTVMTEASDTFNRFAGNTYGAGIIYDVGSEELDPETNGGAAVEWRFRNNSGTTWFDIAMTDASSDAEFARFTSNFSNVSINMLNSTESPQTGSLNSSPAWTTYRMVADGSTVEVFKDGDFGTPEVVFNDIGINDPRTSIMLRFWRGAGTNEFDLDYVRWTNGNAPETTTFTWDLTGGGDWNTSTNWSPLTAPPVVPNGNHDAIFADKIAAGSTVFTDLDVSVRRIDFDHDQTYVVAGAGSINLITGTDSSGDLAPVINTLQGTHKFQAPVHFHDDGSVNVGSDSTLIFDGALHLTGNELTKTGTGTMSIRNDLVTGGGTLIIAEGMVSGNGTLGGDIDNNGGVISPGNSGAAAAATVVPEPGSLMLLVLGGVLIGWACARRK